MIAELVRQYDTLKGCNIVISDPYFDKLEVWVEIVLKPDGSFRVNWLGKPKKTSKDKKPSIKEEGDADVNCPVTEKSACRSSGNDSPHGLVDNAMWIFGKFAKEKKSQTKPKKKNNSKQKEEKIPPDEARRQAFLNQLQAFCNHSPARLDEVKVVHDCLSDATKREALWEVVEKKLKDHIVDGKGVKLYEHDKGKWQKSASGANIRWVVEKLGESGKPVNALESVKKEWKAFQNGKNGWKIVSLIDGEFKPARILHPRIKGASLISFNNVATYCGHLSAEYRGKPEKRKEEQKDNNKEQTYQESRQKTSHVNEKEETDGSALPAQVGFEEAEKYSKALEWLVENSSVRFGDSVNCVWIDQEQSNGSQLDQSAHEFVKPQNEKSIFSRGKAKGGKGQVLADRGDLLKALELFRNGKGKEAGYRDKRFYLLSLLLRRKGRHAILGSYVGTMGLLDDNANQFVGHTKILIPPRYLTRKDEGREFCPSLMDILSAAGIKSEKKLRLVWDREVVEVIVAGRPLPVDLCRLVVQRAIRDKHLEGSEKKRSEYLALLATAAGCAKHFLTAIKKEGYEMGLDTNVRDIGYLTGRLFALCENIQKRGRSWGPTLSDKLFSAAMDMPRQTLVQLYKNCLCYDLYKADREWIAEIFDKVKLDNGDCGEGEVMPETGVDQFAFMLGYWHQRGELAKDKQ